MNHIFRHLYSTHTSTSRPHISALAVQYTLRRLVEQLGGEASRDELQILTALPRLAQQQRVELLKLLRREQRRLLLATAAARRGRGRAASARQELVGKLRELCSRRERLHVSLVILDERRVAEEAQRIDERAQTRAVAQRL